MTSAPVDEHAEQVSSIGQEWFREPMGELARKRQVALTITSLLLLLVSTEIIAIKEAALFGLTFMPSRVLPLVWILECATVTLAIVFWLAAALDYQQRNMKRLPLLVTMWRRLESINTTMKEQARETSIKVKEAGAAVANTLKLIGDIGNDFEKARGEYEATGIAVDTSRLKARLAEAEDLIARDSVTIGALPESPFQNEAASQFDAFREILSRGKRLDRLRFYVEIAGPSVLAIISLAFGAVWLAQHM